MCGFYDHRGGRLLLRLTQLDHERLTSCSSIVRVTTDGAVRKGEIVTYSIAAPGQYLGGCDAAADTQFVAFVVCAQTVNASQIRRDRAFGRIDGSASCHRCIKSARSICS